MINCPHSDSNLDLLSLNCVIYEKMMDSQMEIKTD